MSRYNYPGEYLKKSEAALETALNETPLYRERRKFDPGPGEPVDKRYAVIPELTKADIRRHFPGGLVSGGLSIEDGLERGEIEYTFTSGTTDEKVVNVWDQKWWQNSEKASWKLNSHLSGLEYPRREAKLASSLNIGISCEEDLPMSHRTIGRQLYLNEKVSILQWQNRHYKRMADELEIFRPVILEANPSLLARLAYWAMDNDRAVFSPEVIVLTYEYPSRIHVEAIKRVFGSHIVSSYGSTETGFVLQQCEQGFYHQNTKFCRVDFEPFKDVFGGPELGRILVTTFDNPWNAILKFDLGDIIRLHPEPRCGCGREEGLIAAAIEGRASNATFAPNGALVTTMAVDNALAMCPGIRDYNLEQRGPADYLLEVMLRGDPAAARGELLELLRSVYGPDGAFEIVFSQNILPGPSGKFRRTRMNAGFDEKGLLS